MPELDWTERTRDTLARYAESLLRDVAAQLVKPRAAIPADELVDKCLSTLSNPPIVDRRIRELPESARKLLAVMGLSRRPTWRAGHLAMISAALGHPDGFIPVLALLQNGLLFPDLPADAPSEVVQFESWLGWAGTQHAPLFAPPAVASRARAEDLGLPVLVAEEPSRSPPRVADGLDWPLRLAVVWQMVQSGPVRLTQASTLFKRDLTRLQGDDVLTSAPPDQLVPLPDPGVLTLFWAASVGLLKPADGELRAAEFPDHWNTQLSPTLTELWAALAGIEAWDPLLGYAPIDMGLSPTPTAGLLVMILLARLPAGQWADPQAIANWLWEHHPSWNGVLPPTESQTSGRGWVESYLLGVMYPLRMIESTAGLVRLTDLGRHLLAGGAEPPAAPVFPQSLLVQPNAEVLAYRQGLTPVLIGKLSRFARWKGLGPACTLELNADQTYRGLESGLTLAGIGQTLAQHGMKPVPAPVQDLLRRWADKRDRISIFGSATLVEFQTPADLDAAINRGVVALKLTDRIGMTDDGRDPDFKQLRLIGNRDYEAKPQLCVSIADDGLTLTVDAGQSDLLLEAEIGKLADPILGDPPGVRRYALTPDTLRRAVAAGMSLAEMDTWFQARSGHPLSAAGRLLVGANALPPLVASRLIVVKVPSEPIADGLMQWTGTRHLIAERLGGCAVVVEEPHLPALREVLAEIGITFSGLDGNPNPV